MLVLSYYTIRFIDWCKNGQFICGSSKVCIDQGKVCDGMQDCPLGEDEKKCAALIEDDFLDSTKQEKFEKKSEQFGAQEMSSPKDVTRVSHEISSSETSHFRTNIKNDLMSAKIENSESSSHKIPLRVTHSLVRKTTPTIEGREISMDAKYSLVSGNSFTSIAKKDYHLSRKKEVDNYGDKGYVNIRRNGKWGKLCLTDIENLLKESYNSWTIEDLGRAVCRALTYQ